MKKISEFATNNWKLILVFYLVVNSYSKIDQGQIVLANRIDKIEQVAEKLNRIELLMTDSYARIDQTQVALSNRLDKTEKFGEKINNIEILVERIDERTSKNNGR